MRLAFFIVLAFGCGSPTEVEPDDPPLVTLVQLSGEYFLESVNGTSTEAVVKVDACSQAGVPGADSLSVGPGGTVTFVAGTFDVILITHARCYVNGRLAVFTDETSLVRGSFQIAGDSLTMTANRASARVRGGTFSGEFSRTTSPDTVRIRPDRVTFTIEDLSFGVTYGVTYTANP